MKVKAIRLSGSTAFSSIELSEKNEVPNRVQVLRTGKFSHPSYGNFEITKKILADMKANHDARVRGVDVAFDYFHASDKEASAWVQELELSENGEQLWAVVEWTPKAAQKLSEKELRYFSPDFTFKWKDPESGKVYNNVLFGGGLTNRPFIKEMAAIVADETKGDVMKTIEELQAEVKALEDKNLKLTEEKTLVEKKIADLGDVDSVRKENEELKTKLADSEKKISDMEQAKLLAEKETKFNLLLSEGKACAAQKDAFVKGDMEEFIRLAQPLNTKPAGASDTTEADYETRVLKLAEEKVKKDPSIDFGVAVSEAKKEIKK